MTDDLVTGPKPPAPYAALFAVQLLFGSLPVIAKVVLASVPSVALVGFRVGITAIALYAFQRSRGRLRLSRRSDYGHLAVLSLFGVTFNQLLFVGGLSLTKASNTSLLAVTIPVFTLAVSAAIGGERLRVRKVVGILVAAVGVLVLIDPRSASFSSKTTVGDLMIVANSFSYGIYVATSKHVVMRNGALRSITWIFIFATIVCVPLGLISFQAAASVDPTVWLLIVYIGIFATATPYLLNAWALARVNPSTVAIFVYLQPLIGFIMAVVFLGETIGPAFGIASLLVFAGVYLTARRGTLSGKRYRRDVVGSRIETKREPEA